MHVSEELVDAKGKIDFAAAGLVAYVHGEYYGIKKSPLGRFGYSVMKPKTRRRLNKQKHMERVEKKQNRDAPQRTNRSERRVPHRSRAKDGAALEHLHSCLRYNGI